MIHTSLSPNAQSDDILLALSLLVRPFTWSRKELVSNVEKALGANIKVDNVIAVDSGRTALYTLLKALGISHGHEVLIQGYTCVAVPDPILWVGATPVYVDCSNDLTIDVEDMKKKITPSTKAIVVQHTFGMPAKMSEILAIAKAHNIFVIEDCAHALGGKLNGKPLGSFGDAAFFSFGRDKCISSVFGGAIATNSTILYEKVQNIVESYPQPSAVWIMRQLLHPIILAVAKSTYNVFNIGKLVLGAARRLRIISKAVEPKELRGEQPSFVRHRFSPALAMLALNQFKKLSIYTRHRQECALLYSQRLVDLQSIESPPYIDGHVYLRYTIFVDQPSQLITKARSMGIELGDWYSNVLAPTGVLYDAVGYQRGSCPNAERLASRSINLPTHIGITPQMIEKIINYVLV